MARPNAQEFWLLKLLLVSDEAAAAAVGRVRPEWIRHATAREIIARRLALQESGAWRGFATFLAEFDSPQTSSLMSEAASDDRKIPDPEKQVLDVALRLRNQFIDRELTSLTQRVSQPGIAQEELVAVLQQQKVLRELKRQPN